MTRRDWVRDAHARLARAGVEAPRLEAQLLAACALGIERSQLLPHLEEPMSNTKEAHELLGRRLEGEPLAYLRGHREFFGREFRVGPGVLVPRHETETLVEVLLRLAPPGARVLDVGTGSGCIAVSAKLERPDLDVVAIDRSFAALRWADENRRALRAAIGLVRGDLVSPFPSRSFDVIASNPPYVARTDPLPAEVSQWEPAEALWAGDDGLAVFSRLAHETPRVLEAGGLLILEVGRGQSDAVIKEFKAKGWRHVETTPDLTGIPRILTLRMP